MLTDKQIADALDLIDDRYHGVITKYLQKVGKTINEIGHLNQSSVNLLIQLRRMGVDVQTIERELQKVAEDDAEAEKFFGVNGRDKLTSIVKRSTIKLENGFACFPDGDPLNENVKKVKPLKTYFDVAMHGTPSGVCFGTKEVNMSARLLASVIRHSEGYEGQKIRLLACSTGLIIGEDYCFAEELANALGVDVKAPNDELFISNRGRLSVGIWDDGTFITYKPNQRGRVK